VNIDFTPVDNGEIPLYDFCQRFSVAELRAVTNTSIDTIVDIIKDLNDAQVTHMPHDPNAKDDYAVAGEEHIGWSVAHLLVHVTASSEEGAAHSSVLARGIPYPTEPRLRYETSWHTVTTKAECVQCLEESRRMRLAFLDTWPDEPHLDTLREVSPRFIERFGQMNAKMAFVFGLKHEVGHYDQIRDAARQAREAAATA
jgi:DinB superfamily